MCSVQNERWNEIAIPEGELYEWDTKSTYIQEPPFFTDLGTVLDDIADIHGAKALLFWAIPLQQTISPLPVTSKLTAQLVNT